MQLIKASAIGIVVLCIIAAGFVWACFLGPKLNRLQHTSQNPESTP